MPHGYTWMQPHNHQQPIANYSGAQPQPTRGNNTWNNGGQPICTVLTPNWLSSTFSARRKERVPLTLQGAPVCAIN